MNHSSSDGAAPERPHMLTTGRFRLTALFTATITFGLLVGVTVLKGDEPDLVEYAFIGAFAGIVGGYGGMRGITRRSTERASDAR